MGGEENTEEAEDLVDDVVDDVGEELEERVEDVVEEGEERVEDTEEERKERGEYVVEKTDERVEEADNGMEADLDNLRRLEEETTEEEREFEEVADEIENQLELDMVDELLLEDVDGNREKDISFEFSISDYGDDLNEGIMDADDNNGPMEEDKSVTEDEFEPLTAGILSKFKQYRNLLADETLSSFYYGAVLQVFFFFFFHFFFSV